MKQPSSWLVNLRIIHTSWRAPMRIMGEQHLPVNYQVQDGVLFLNHIHQELGFNRMGIVIAVLLDKSILNAIHNVHDISAK